MCGRDVSGLLVDLARLGHILLERAGYPGTSGFVLSMNRSQIEPEERALIRLFGLAFVTYTTQVRRWR